MALLECKQNYLIIATHTTLEIPLIKYKLMIFITIINRKNQSQCNIVLDQQINPFADL